MPSNANRQFLDFEKPIKDLIDTIEKYKHDAEKNKMDMSEPIRQLEESILQKKKRDHTELKQLVTCAVKPSS